jgi:4-amino-4-deoxy-L-arabinose transferase-like glycosyltransferase
VCGIVQVELCFRASRYAFPQKEKLQIISLLVGALLPINVYGSQAVGNEAFAGCLISTVLVMCFHLIKTNGDVSRRFLVMLGVFSGLAILAKMTAIILLPVILLLLLYFYPLDKSTVKNNAISVFFPIIVALAVSSWFFVRNRFLLGSFNIGDWDQNIFLNYWQDPGYRTIKQFYRFGASLITPVFTAMYGFWDGVYSTLTMDGYLGSADTYELRPPWNYNWLFSGPLLAIVPLVGIIMGFIRALFNPKKSIDNCTLFSSVILAVYISAMMFHFLQVPFYSSVRATYLMGALTCMGILSAYGLDMVLRHPLAKAFIYAWLACWASEVYLAYFIL